MTLFSVPAFGQSGPAQSDPVLLPVYPNLWELSWESVDGRTYFLQYTEELSLWHYFPVIEFGDGLPLSWGFDAATGSGRFQVRLRYLDVATTDPDLADFDGDGLPNLVEVAVLGSDPLEATASPDTDNDGLPDAWELHFWGHLNAQSDTDDADSDGLTNKEEFQLTLNPTVPEAGSAALRTTFSYDNTGRLIGAVTPGGSAAWQPDEEGNILSAPAP